MIRAFFGTRKWALWAWGGLALLLASLYIQVYMSVLFNQWYGRFYDMLQAVEKYTIADFNDSLWYFMYIAMVFVVLGTFTNWFTRHYSLAWRQAMTFDYIPQWVNVEEEIEGSSQRIQEDTYRFAKLVESLGLQVVRAVMTLVAFIPILWQLGKHVTVPIIGKGEGNLVWAALVVSLGGMVISWFVGWYLPGLEYNNQMVEAAFRKELVLGEDNKVDYCSIPVLTELFTGIKFNYKRLFLHYGYFDLWGFGYDQFMVIVPYLIAGPALFSMTITLGTVVQISNAFGKVQSSLSLFIQNWTTVTELRSIHKRLHEFQKNLTKHLVGPVREAIVPLHIMLLSKASPYVMAKTNWYN
jgi:peptide/bleomycin uptake transporter